MAAKKKQITSSELQNLIELKAYEIFLSRGGEGGSHEDDWLKAEAEVLKTYVVSDPAAE